MQDKIIPKLFLLFGVYLATIGFFNLKKNKKILDIFSMIELYFIKIRRGMVAYENRKSDILGTSKHKLFSIYYLVVGISITVVGLFLLFQ